MVQRQIAYTRNIRRNIKAFKTERSLSELKTDVLSELVRTALEGVDPQSAENVIAVIKF